MLTDRDRNGVLDVNEFLIGIKGDLSERRKKFVKMAFNLLDTDRSGFVTVEEMMAIYDFSQHPEVKTGKKTVKEAMREFMG
jgi:Ca2+-binding EF-hand superfamily protein